MGRTGKIGRTGGPRGGRKEKEKEKEKEKSGLTGVLAHGRYRE
jgi:hypothetical protein